eukprot:SM002168S06762  [mRNA]  locus=s2168:118:309:+ [translate_table: standard]
MSPPRPSVARCARPPSWLGPWPTPSAARRSSAPLGRCWLFTTSPTSSSPGSLGPPDSHHPQRA